jgi:acetate kinase
MSSKLAVYATATLDCTERFQTSSAEEAEDWLRAVGKETIAAVGHRVVHGGARFTEPTLLTPDVLHELHALIPLAPLHQPAALKFIDSMQQAFPDVPHIACFDTAFHRTQPKLATMFALPRALYDEGIRRYGFHGLSYEYIAAFLPEIAGQKAKGRVIIAHLGGGASMCAMRDSKSVATTMGLSTLDGLMMGTRSGAIDPGVLLYLQREKNMSLEALERLLYHESGLKDVSGIGADMRVLLANVTKEASEAVQLYCYLAARHIAALAVDLGGLDLLVFTGGIGEHQPDIRERICAQLLWMGVMIDSARNMTGNGPLASDSGAVGIYAIPTNEELVIARHCRELLQDS